MPTLSKKQVAWEPSLAGKMQSALFLDRDGVINVGHGYVHHPADLRFADGIFDVAQAARTYGYRLVVVTNHVGRGGPGN